MHSTIDRVHCPSGHRSDGRRHAGRRFDRRLCALVLGTALLAGCGGGGAGGGTASPPTSASSGPPSTPPPVGTPRSLVVSIDVLALVSDSVAQQYADPDLRVTHFFDVANDVLAAGGIDLEFNIVGIRHVAYADSADAPTALDDLTFGRDPALAAAVAERDALHADLVVLIRPYANDGYCGYAWTGGLGTNGDFSDPAQADFGFSVVSSDCSDYELLHEFGHNLGLVHSRSEVPAGGSLSYGAGFGRDNDFVTIMAMPAAFNAVRLPVMSDPSRSCNGHPCGVDYLDPNNGADSARALGITMTQVAAYR
ncbi:MAG TPA: zinc-dependent metalloprotease family protein [Pseudomonadales bacterium]|nr:zinc-dependent metalloprotease family protein [Pseudomonadales bacterium]